MLRKSIRWGIVVVALAAPLTAACIDLHTAEECDLTLSCPPDAGDAGDAGDTGMDAGDGDAH